MSFRVKLLLAFTVSIGAAVALVAWGVSVSTRRAFEQFESQRSQALLAQFQSEFAQRGDVVAHRIAAIADSEATVRMALDLNRPGADSSIYVNDAQSLAKSDDLDYVDFAGDDGMLVSSAEWPAHFGYKNDWITSESDWNQQGAFLTRVETADSVELGLLAVRVVAGGRRRSPREHRGPRAAAERARGGNHRVVSRSRGSRSVFRDSVARAKRRSARNICGRFVAARAGQRAGVHSLSGDSGWRCWNSAGHGFQLVDLGAGHAAAGAAFAHR